MMIRRALIPRAISVSVVIPAMEPSLVDFSFFVVVVIVVVAIDRDAGMRDRPTIGSGGSARDESNGGSGGVNVGGPESARIGEPEVECGYEHVVASFHAANSYASIELPLFSGTSCCTHRAIAGLHP